MKEDKLAILLALIFSAIIMFLVILAINSDMKKTRNQETINAEAENYSSQISLNEIDKNFKFEHNGKRYSIHISINPRRYEYYQSIPRTKNGMQYITENERVIVDIASTLKEISDKNHEDINKLVSSFVQYIPYERDIVKGVDDYPKYPIETLLDNRGDCEDDGYLAVSILRALGRDCAILHLPGHIAMGVTGDYNGITYGGYFYQELTGLGWQVGELPKKFMGVAAEVWE